MAEPYRDFFRELAHCLQAQRSRSENYASLRARLDRVRNQQSPEARSEHALLNQAMSVFKDEQRYRDWRKQWEAAARGGSKHEDEASRRKAEIAQERARKAEEAHRREAERAKALQRELEEAKQQAAQAEMAHAARRKAEEARRSEAERTRALERELEAAKQRAAQAEQDREAAAKESRRPFWAQLGQKILDHLVPDSTPPTSSGPAPVPQFFQPTPVNLTGEWIADDGNWFSFWQNGGQIRVQGKNILGQIISDGQGPFDGRQFRIQFQTAPILTPMGFIPTIGEAWGEVSADGNFIRSQGINHTLRQPFQMGLRRR